MKLALKFPSLQKAVRGFQSPIYGVVVIRIDCLCLIQTIFKYPPEIHIPTHGGMFCVMCNSISNCLCSCHWIDAQNAFLKASQYSLSFILFIVFINLHRFVIRIFDVMFPLFSLGSMIQVMPFKTWISWYILGLFRPNNFRYGFEIPLSGKVDKLIRECHFI